MNKLWKGAKAAMGMVLAVAMVLPVDIANTTFAAEEPTIINPEPVELEDGVVLHKTAKAVDGEINKWDVTLRVEYAKDHMRSDTVLVIDTSNSMKNDEKLVEAKNAAKVLARQLLPEGNTNNRVAIVSFNDSVRVSSFGSSVFGGLYSAVENRIDNLRAAGATFTQGGIHRAAELLAESNADIKNMILLSDGEPTLSYQIDTPNDYLVDGGPGKHEKQKETSVEVPQSAFLYNERNIGTGTGTWAFYDSTNLGTEEEPDWEYYYYNASNCAIAEAGYYKTSNNGDLYAIALSAGEEGSRVLGEIATPGKAYVASVDDLADIFGQIAEQIAYNVQDAEVSDVMSDGIMISSGSGARNMRAESVKWEPEFVYDGDSGKYVAEMTYRVEATDDIVKNINNDGYASFSKKTTIRYNNDINADFPEPMVRPLTVNITEELAGRTCTECTFKVELTHPGGTKTLYEIAPGATKTLIGGLVEGEYSIEEIGSTKDAVYFINYLVKYNQKTFVIDENHNRSVDIDITNIYDTVDIVATKHWDDNSDKEELRKKYRLYIAIKRGNVYVDYQRLNGDGDNEIVIFANLPKYYGGEVVEYEIEESMDCRTEKTISACNKYEGDDDYTVYIDGYDITNTHITEIVKVEEDLEEKYEGELIVKNTIDPCLLNRCGKGAKIKAPETGKSTEAGNSIASVNIAMMMISVLALVLIVGTKIYSRRN